MSDRDPGLAPPMQVGGVGMVALVASIVVIFYLGVLPTRVLDLAAASISTIF